MSLLSFLHLKLKLETIPTMKLKATLIAREIYMCYLSHYSVLVCNSSQRRLIESVIII